MQAILSLISTIGISLAALASLITIFKSSQHFELGDVLDFRGIVLSSLMICIGSILPMLLLELFDQSTAWRISSLIFFFVVLLLQIQLEKDIRSGQYVTVWPLTSLTLRIATGIINFAVFVGILTDTTDKTFVVGIFWTLTVTILRLYIFLVSATNEYSLPSIYKMSDSNKPEEK